MCNKGLLNARDNLWTIGSSWHLTDIKAGNDPHWQALTKSLLTNAGASSTNRVTKKPVLRRSAAQLCRPRSPACASAVVSSDCWNSQCCCHCTRSHSALDFDFAFHLQARVFSFFCIIHKTFVLHSHTLCVKDYLTLKPYTHCTIYFWYLSDKVLNRNDGKLRDTRIPPHCFALAFTIASDNAEITTKG